MKVFLVGIFSLFAISCTNSVILTDTHGQASDVVDSTPTTQTEADPDINIPINPPVLKPTVQKI